MPCAVDSRYEDQEELRHLTQAACELAKAYRAGGGKLEDLSPAARDWIRRHDAEDEANREAEERAARLRADRQRVIESLSPEQRRVLGLG